MVSGRRDSAPLQPASTVLTFLRPASSRQGSRCQASQSRQSRPLSTKSEAVPAEGVACLTLHRPAAPGETLGHRAEPALGRKGYLAGLS